MGHAVATVKVDGICCAIINGDFYKRFDAKSGRRITKGAIACCEPDPITGHWPHWVPVKIESKSDKWFAEAYQNFLLYDCANFSTLSEESFDHPVTLEAIGKHFNGNPYGLDKDTLVRHGCCVICEFQNGTNFDYIKEFLSIAPIEGIVYWADGEPMCKIKRRDFGFEWPCNGASYRLY